MQDLEIYCDYDSFLNDLDQAWLLWVKEKFGRVFTTTDILHWHWLEEQCGPAVNDFWKTPGNYSRIEPKPGAQDFVLSLQDAFGVQRVKVVTTSPAGMEDEKDLHIQKFFNIAPPNIIHAAVKWPHTSGGVLLDDNKDHVMTHSSKNQQMGIVFDHDGNYGWSKFAPDDVFNPDLVKVAHSYGDILRHLSIFN